MRKINSFTASNPIPDARINITTIHTILRLPDAPRRFSIYNTLLVQKSPLKKACIYYIYGERAILSPLARLFTLGVCQERLIRKFTAAPSGSSRTARRKRCNTRESPRGRADMASAFELCVPVYIFFKRVFSPLESRALNFSCFFRGHIYLQVDVCNVCDGDFLLLLGNKEVAGVLFQL